MDAGVGRGLGLGPVLGVRVGLGVAVGVTVAVAVRVAVGVAALSLIRLVPNTRSHLGLASILSERRRLRNGSVHYN
jgi:hypothetical protein